MKDVAKYFAVGCMSMVGLLGCQQSSIGETQAADNTNTTPKTTKAQQALPASKPTVPPVTLNIAAVKSLSSILPVLVTDFTSLHPNISVNLSYDTGINLYDSIGATNKKNFDIFLAANQIFPKLMYEGSVKQNPSQPKYGKPFTYARGQLVLYSKKHVLDVTPNTTLDNFLLDHNGEMTLAVANPQISSYGVAAENWLVNQNLYQMVEASIVYKPNIDETFNATDKGEVDFGLVSLSQVLAKPGMASSLERSNNTNYTILPKDSYPQILQDGIVLQPAQASQQFVEYLLTARAQDVMTDAGYLPICAASNLLPACK